MDILYKNSSHNISLLKQTLSGLDYEIGHLKEDDYKSPDRLRLGQLPTAIDLINQTVGIDYNTVFDNAKSVFLDKLEIRVIAINNLIKNKRALKTFKDLADAEALERIQKRIGE